MKYLGMMFIFCGGVIAGAAMDTVYSNTVPKAEAVRSEGRDEPLPYIAESWKYRECERLLNDRSE